MATPPGGPYGSSEYGDEYPAQPPGSGRTGRYNFPSAPSGRRTPVPGARPEEPAPPRPDRGPGPGAGPGPGGYGQDWHPQQPPQPPHQAPHPSPQASTPRGHRHDKEAPQPLVRPYAMTGGRTRPRYQLAIEALVSTTASPVQLQGQLPEHQRICQLCYEVKSVAEVSALLSIPLGV
ncbi:DUF742 domain-containing protein, partial [Streptomyces sp. 7-21]|uniref:DUF742 domain-containing protein n=1 Tax=Streptomyces sp. 7-21 TaxID=2802283 RepID=UPI00191DCFD3